MMYKSIFETEAFNKLTQHFNETKGLHLRGLFQNNANRGKELSILLGDMFFDYSKNRITNETLSLFEDSANEINLQQQIEDLFTGKKINQTENRAVLHTALRDFTSNSIEVEGKKQEAIKLFYGERDILYLSIHALHKITKFNGKDGKPPKVYKLGSKAWKVLKQKTKSKNLF